MKNILLLHQEYHPKDVLRCVLHIIYKEMRGPVFRDLLGVDRAMVAHHKPKNLKDLVIPSRMQNYNEVYLKASTYSEKHIWRLRGASVKDRVHKIVSDDKVSVGMRERLHDTFNLVGQDVHYNSYKKKFMCNARSRNDKVEKSQE